MPKSTTKTVSAQVNTYLVIHEVHEYSKTDTNEDEGLRYGQEEEIEQILDQAIINTIDLQVFFIRKLPVVGNWQEILGNIDFICIVEESPFHLFDLDHSFE